MLRQPPRSTLFPTRRSSDLFTMGRIFLASGKAQAAEMHLQLAEQLADPRKRNAPDLRAARAGALREQDRKSTRLNSSHVRISYAVFCLKKKKKKTKQASTTN